MSWLQKYLTKCGLERVKGNVSIKDSKEATAIANSSN
jgi:hypothetical protein